MLNPKEFEGEPSCLRGHLNVGGGWILLEQHHTVLLVVNHLPRDLRLELVCLVGVEIVFLEVLGSHS